MNCQELQDLVLFGAAGVLDADEQRQVQEHLSDGCPRCEGYRAEAEAVLAQLSMTVSPVQPSASVKRALMSKVRRSLEPVQPAMNLRMPLMPWWRVAFPASIAAALAVALTAGAFRAFPSLNGNRGNSSTIAQIPQTPVPAPTNDASTGFNGYTMPRIAGHEYHTVDLSGDFQKAAVGHLRIDVTDNTWTLDVTNLKATMGNQSYVIWVLGSDKVAKHIYKFELTGKSHDFETGSGLPKLDLQHPTKFSITIETDPELSLPHQRQMFGTLNP